MPRSSAWAPWTCRSRSRRCSRTSRCRRSRRSSRPPARCAASDPTLMPANVIMPALELAQETGKLLHWIKSPGDVVPVGQTIAVIADSAAERPGADAGDTRIKASPLARKVAEEHGVDLAHVRTAGGKIEKADVLAYVESRRGVAAPGNGGPAHHVPETPGTTIAASPKARRLAAERGIDLRALKGSGPAGAVLAIDVPEVVVAPPEVARVSSVSEPLTQIGRA